MEPKFKPLVTVRPRDLKQALGWIFVENYTIEMALKKATWTCEQSAITEVKKYRVHGTDAFLIRFKLRYENQMMSQTAPEGLILQPLDLGDLTPFQEFKLYFRWEHLTQFYRYSAVITYVLALIAFLPLMNGLVNRLVRYAQEHAWFVYGQCDLTCAKKIAAVHGHLIVAVIPQVLCVVWAAFFYWRNKVHWTHYTDRQASTIECLLLLMIGVALMHSQLQSPYFAHYRQLVAGQMNGTLNLRQPASDSK
jgi:hypothetical protein